jgi:hypothetical protein
MKFHTDRRALGAVLASAEEDGFHTRVFWLEELQAGPGVCPARCRTDLRRP